MRSWLTRLAFIVGLLLNIYLGATIWAENRASAGSARPNNILILSFCSMRWEQLPIFNPGAQPLPNFAAFFEGSYIFRNAINGLPWTNITNNIDFVGTFLPDLGYSNHRQRVRIPPISINSATDSLLFSTNQEWVRNFDLNLTIGLHRLKRRIYHVFDGGKPFFIAVHVKYLHFPYIDQLNQRDLWKTEFTKKSADLLTEYLKNPARHTDKTPLFLTLFADPNLVRTNPLAKRYVHDFNKVTMGQIYQILLDPDVLQNWKSSAHFADDLEIMKEAYYLKLKFLDEQLAPVLNLYGDSELRRNTTILLTGDHGESFMENGSFLHANNIEDQSVKVPMAIRPPQTEGLEEPVNLDGQFDFSKTSELMELLSRHRLSKNLLSGFLAKECGTIYMQNCDGKISGLRYENKFRLQNDPEGWKLIDLKAPQPNTDVQERDSEDFFRLREKFLDLESHSRALWACTQTEVDPTDRDYRSERIQATLGMTPDLKESKHRGRHKTRDKDGNDDDDGE